MTDHHATRSLNGHIAGSLLFLALAFAGWGAFLYHLRDTSDLRNALTAQVARLEADLGQVTGERDQWRAAGERQREIERELVELRTQLRTAEAEAAALRQTEQQRTAELEAARQEVASLTEQLDQANARVSQTGTLNRPKRTTRRRGAR
jgi:chromosome segregation ATPase